MGRLSLGRTGKTAQPYCVAYFSAALKSLFSLICSQNHPEWGWAGVYVRSYKQTALGMFKRFCSAVSKSNGNFVFDGGAVNSDEKTLAGKKIGIIFREEEYYGNDGEKKTRLSVYGEFPVSELANQRTPKKKELPPDGNALANAGTSADVDEIPF